MSELRDYVRWHQAYEDPDSDLSWRLRTVQGYLREALDRQPGPVRVLSVCSGDGRDLIGVLAERPDRDRVTATLLELHPGIADQARQAAAAAGLPGVEVRTTDAGTTDAYVGLVPADLVLLVGILGNMSEADVLAVLDTAPQLCAAGATLVWSRGILDDGLNDRIRARFAELGFLELDYAVLRPDNGPALGAVRFHGQPQPLVPGRPLFTFLR